MQQGPGAAIGPTKTTATGADLGGWLLNPAGGPQPPHNVQNPAAPQAAPAEAGEPAAPLITTAPGTTAQDMREESDTTAATAPLASSAGPVVGLQLPITAAATVQPTKPSEPAAAVPGTHVQPTTAALNAGPGAAPAVSDSHRPTATAGQQAAPAQPAPPATTTCLSTSAAATPTAPGLLHAPPAEVPATPINMPKQQQTTTTAAAAAAGGGAAPHGNELTALAVAPGSATETPAAASAPAAVESDKNTTAPPVTAAAAAAGGNSGGGNSGVGGGGVGRKRGKKHPKQPPPGAKNQLKGVFWDRKTGRWRSQLGYHNKKIFMGYFNTPQEAAVAYDKKAVELHGMLAKTNFPIVNYQQLLPEGAGALPTAEMAIPVTKKQNGGTDADKASLQDPAAAAAGGGAGSAVSMESGGAGGMSEGLVEGDDSALQGLPQQQQHSPERRSLEGVEMMVMSSTAAAAVAALTDAGVEVPVLPAAAAATAQQLRGGGAAAGRPVRNKRKMAWDGGVNDDEGQAAAEHTSIMELDDDDDHKQSTAQLQQATSTPTASRGALTPRPPLSPGSSKQQQQQRRQLFVRSGSTRGSGRRGAAAAGRAAGPAAAAAPRGSRPRGRPRSVVYQGLAGWGESPEPEGMRAPGVDGVSESHHADKGPYCEGTAGFGPRQGSGHWGSQHQRLTSTDGYQSGDLALFQQLEGMASGDIRAAQALAGLLQLGNREQEADVVEYFSEQQQQQQQQRQPGYQDYAKQSSIGPGSREGYYRGLSNMPEVPWGDGGVRQDDAGQGWQQQQQPWQQHGTEYGYAPDEHQLGMLDWHHRSAGGSGLGARSVKRKAATPTVAAHTAWQQECSPVGDDIISECQLAHGRFSNSSTGQQGYGARGSGFYQGGYHATAETRDHWQQQQEEEGGDSDVAVREHAAALAALPDMSQPTAAAARVGEGDSDLDQLLQLIQSALAASNGGGSSREQQQQRRQQQQQHKRVAVANRQLTVLQQLQQALSKESQALQLEVEQRHALQPQATHKAAAAARYHTEDFHTPAHHTGNQLPQQLLSLLLSALAPVSPPAVQPQPQPMRLAAPAAAIRAPTPAAASAAAAGKGEPSQLSDLAIIDEALLMLPPEQQRIINQQPELRPLLAAVVRGTAELSYSAAPAEQEQQQQQGLTWPCSSQPMHGSETFHHHDSPQATYASGAPYNRATAAHGGTLPQLSTVSNMGSPNKPSPADAVQLNPAATASALSQTQGLKRRPLIKGSVGRGAGRTGSGPLRPATEVNPGGVTFKKGQPKSLKLWGTGNQAPGLSPPGKPAGKGLGLMLPPGGAGSSSSPGSNPVQPAQPLQLPQLLPLLEMSKHTPLTSEQQQQQVGDDASDLESLVSAVLKVWQPSAPSPAAGAADTAAGGDLPALASVNDDDFPDRSAFEPPSKRHRVDREDIAVPAPTHTEQPPDRTATAAPTPSGLKLTVPVPTLTPQQQQQSGHSTNTPPGSSTPRAEAAPAARGAGTSACSTDVVMESADARLLDGEPFDVAIKPSLSFREWHPVTAQPPPAAAAADDLQRAGSSGAALAAVGGLHTALHSQQQHQLASQKEVKPGATPAPATIPPAAAAAIATIKGWQQLPQHNRKSRELGLKLHVLSPHAMLLPAVKVQLQAAAAAEAAGGSNTEGSSAWCADPAAVLAAVSALPSVLSAEGGVADQVWENAAGLAAADSETQPPGSADTAAATSGAAAESSAAAKSSNSSERMVRVHLQVVSDKHQQHECPPRGHLVLLPVVVPLPAAASAPCAGHKTPTHDNSAAAAASAAEKQVTQQQHQVDLPSELAQLPPSLQSKVLELRHQIQAKQGGVLTAQQDITWLLRQMVAAVKRKVDAKQQMLQQQQYGVQQSGPSRAVQSDQHQAMVPVTPNPAAARAGGGGPAEFGRGSRTITTGVSPSGINLQQLLMGAAATLLRDSNVAAAQPVPTRALAPDGNDQRISSTTHVVDKKGVH